MKKIILILSVFLIVMNLQSQERFDTDYRLENNANSKTWLIAGTADDTSNVFDLYSCQSIQYCFNDTSGTWDDSVAYKIELLAASVNIDSSFQLIQTITSSETTAGYRPIKAINTPPAPYGKIVLTGLNGNTILNGLYGWFIINGWSNAEGMSTRLR